MILHILSSLALKHVIRGVGTVLGSKDGDLEELFDRERVLHFLRERFSEPGQRLNGALKRSNDRAWRALELALAGESFWSWLDKKEDKIFREHLRAFVDAHPLPNADGRDDKKRICLADLRAARKDGLLSGELNDPEALAREAGAFARFSDPLRLLDAEWGMIGRLAEGIRKAGYPDLAELIGRRSEQPPLLIVAVRYFFQQAVETDQALFQGLAFARLEGVAEGQAAGFDALDRVLQSQGGRLDEALERFTRIEQDIKQLKGDVGGVNVNVLDVKAEQEKLADHLRQFHREVMHALEDKQLQARELRPSDSLSLSNDAERLLVKQLVARYRALPEEQRRQMPALLNALGKLEVAAGDFESAERSFQQVTTLVSTPSAQAEAQYNGYRTALERRDWTTALLKLRSAAKLDPGRFTPFPLEKYHPLRILGAGGFGAAFLCRHQHTGGQCVVKTLLHDETQSHPERVFAEASHLQRLDHPAIIRVQDCGYVNAAARSRPYLVMDYFEGPSLEQYVGQSGPLQPAALPELARRIAEGLAAAHQKGILHRDVKPGNVLVRREASGWQVKLIDFGLALESRSLSDKAHTAATGRSMLASSIAGTLEYAAPEQLGKLPGVPVGTYSDVYGFGKTLCYALFQNAQPTFQDWRTAGERLATLLGQCLAERPERRWPDFPAVLKQLALLGEASSRPVVALPPPLPIDILKVEPEELIFDAEAAPPSSPPPLPPPLPPAVSAANAKAGLPDVQRQLDNVTVQFQGHIIRIDCAHAGNLALVTYDGRVMARVRPAPEASSRFQAVEDGAAVRYEVVVRGARNNVPPLPLFTIRRNGYVLYNDR